MNPESPRDESYPDDDENQAGNNRPDTNNQDAPLEKAAMELKIPLSQSLLTRFKAMAEDEGIGMMELGVELIAEGLTKRAWDTQGQNRPQPGSSQGQQQQQRSHQPPNKFNNNRPNNNPNNNNNRNQNNANRAQRNSNIMQDKAAFLEYVRNQEKRRR